MITYQVSIKMSSSQQSTRAASKMSRNDTDQNAEEIERKQELKEKASELQKYIHFEANTKPRILKLSNDVNQIQKDIEELEAKTAKVQENIDNDQKLIKDSELTEEFKNDREQKVKKISELEQKLATLLEEKAKLLQKAEFSLQGK